MRLSYKKGALNLINSGAVIIFENEKSDLKAYPALGAAASIVGPLLKSGEFNASYLSELSLKTDKGWLILVGGGKKEKFTANRLFETVSKAVGSAAARKVKSLDLALPYHATIEEPQALELAASACHLALCRQIEYKSKPEPEPSLKAVTIYGSSDIKAASKILSHSGVSSKAVFLARRLGNAPGNILYPDTFVKEASVLAKALSLKIEVMDEKALAKAKCNLLLAVGQGSVNPPRLVKISYQGGAKNSKPVVLVGKGVTFDSGGLSLKPSASMTGMHTDMCGAAVVLACLLAAAEMKLPLNITAIMPLAENMPDGGAMRVGDIITSRSGQTVEITNTDAEGRLILADALTLAGELKPRLIIDVATLTGACVVALGEKCTGMFCGDENVSKEILEAAEYVGENFWPMPFVDEYEDNLKSEGADMVNAFLSPYGGAIHAALFLRHFVPENTPWAHLDIAGPARASKPRPGCPAGATGVAVRTLLTFLKAFLKA